MNAIEYLKSKGFKVSSDPAKYSSGVWGLRNYTEFGINYDAFCGGYIVTGKQIGRAHV